MTPEQITLVRNTWSKVRPISQKAAAIFYGRLFEVAPAVRPMFRSDISAQGRMLMSMIGTAVASLEKPERVLPAIRDLGRRHAGYGARPEHYAAVGDCLLWTLAQGLGDDFTPEACEAWTATYETLAGVMIAASAE